MNGNTSFLCWPKTGFAFFWDIWSNIKALWNNELVWNYPDILWISKDTQNPAPLIWSKYIASCSQLQYFSPSATGAGFCLSTTMNTNSATWIDEGSTKRIYPGEKRKLNTWTRNSKFGKVPPFQLFSVGKVPFLGSYFNGQFSLLIPPSLALLPWEGLRSGAQRMQQALQDDGHWH